MRILYFTDAHGTMQSPEGRLDDFPVTYLQKLTEIRYAIAYYKADMVICGGDLFHVARLSDKFTGLVAEILRSYGVPIYIVPGNHDIEGYNISSIYTTKLGLLAKTGVIELLWRQEPILVKDKDQDISIAISGQEYYAKIDEGNSNDFMMLNPDSSKADINILVAHAYVTPDPQHPDIKCTLIKDIVTDANIILSGHYHRAFDVIRDDGVAFYNPGSALRIAQTDYNKTHMPQYAILDISLDDENYVTYDYKTYVFKVAKPSTSIFDYTTQLKKKQTSITLEGFKTSLANTMTQTSTANIAIQDIVRAVCADPAIISTYGNVEPLVTQSINNVLVNVKDDLGAPTGYVVDKNTKYIEKVEIHNFEGHLDTSIDFCNGLNVFTGVSGNGKSSIFRAILWVTDNDPSGNVFITTGKKSCWVKVTYSDKSYIKRSRPLKSAGEYEVGQLVNGVMKVDTYKGFGQSVPLEVLNIHQMPKVYLTKDTRCHLNVANQMDAPFLLNESPAQKAAAIGRITGTHIIDLAMQAQKKLIASNKSDIKKYQTDVADWNDQLKAIPDLPAMETLNKEYEAHLQNADILKNKIDKATNFINKINAMDNERKKLCDDKNVFDTVLQQKNDIATVSASFEKILCSYEKAVAHHERILLIDSQINTEKQSLQRYQQMLQSTTKDSTKLLEMSDKLEKMISLNREYSRLSHNKETVEETLSSCNKIKVFQEQELVTATQEFEDYLIGVGICPCCNGEITKDNVEHVKSFLNQ